MINRMTMLLAAAVLICSCSIKEDRTPCPGQLEIGLDSCRAVTSGVHLDGWNGSGEIFSQRVDISQEPGNTVCFSVPKGELGYCAWCGPERPQESVKGLVYMVPQGMQADPLYACSRTGLMMCGEYLHDEAILHRQHCVITLVLEGFPDNRLGGLLVKISSGTVGMNLRDLSPVAGSFQVTGTPDSDGCLSFTVIRQAYGDLGAEIYDGGILAAAYDLSAMLDAVGYDWTAADLSDVTLTLSAASASGGVIIGSWDSAGESDHTI